MKIGTLLRQFRDKLRLSQTDVANTIGVSQSAYQAWENDRATPKAKYIGTLCALLGVVPKQLGFDNLIIPSDGLTLSLT